MTPGRLYLLAVLCLVLAGLLLFGAADTILVNVLGALATVLAVVSYLFGLYLARLGRRGEEALRDLRVRIAQATGQTIEGEHRAFHRQGFEGVPEGELVIFYRTAGGWLLVPLLSELSWVEVSTGQVGLVQIENQDAERSASLRVELKTSAGRELKLLLGSTVTEAPRRSANNVPDLVALKDALRASAEA